MSYPIYGALQNYGGSSAGDQKYTNPAIGAGNYLYQLNQRGMQGVYNEFNPTVGGSYGSSGGVTNSISDFFNSLSSGVKTILFVGVGIIALSYVSKYSASEDR